MRGIGTSLALFASMLMTSCDANTERAVGVEQRGLQPAAKEALRPWESSASVYWNQVTRDLIVKYKSNPFFANRAFGILTTAQYNAIIAAEQSDPQQGGASIPAAVARASVATLTYLFPTEQAALEALLEAELSAPGRPGDARGDVSFGESIGQEIADGVIARAQNDRFFAPWTGTVPVGPGLWFSSATPPAPPVGPMFGLARTYFLNSGDQFRPAPPPAFNSPEFAAALAEVRHISDTRTAEQTAIAVFWALQAGTITPPGFWNQEATNLALRYRLSERETAHALALMNMAGFDALVACHDGKYTYWFIRPSQADPQITMPIALPNFPSYPSNHACISAAEATVLGSLFPADRRRLDAMAEEAAISRIYGGIHYRFDADVGLALGRRVAALALSLDVRGHQAFVLK